MNLAYHISYEDLGESVTLEPRVPMTIVEKYGEDNTTPRICVALRIADCFRLFAWKDWTDEVFVYVADQNAEAHSAEGKTPDWKSGFKEEWWLLKPTKFIRIGKARMFRIPMVTNRPFWTWTKSPLVSVCYDDKYRLSSKELAIWTAQEKKSEEVFREMGEKLKTELEGKK